MRTLRDPHVIGYLLAPVALYPVLFWAAFQFNAYEEGRIAAQPLRVVVQGPAPLVEAFGDPPFAPSSLSPSDEPVEALLSRQIDVYVSGTPQGDAYHVEVHFTSTRPRSRRAHRHALKALDGLEVARVATLLNAAPEEIRPIQVVARAVDGRETFSRRLIAVLVGYVGTFAMLLSAVYPAIDLVVAERQRNTLETLLLSPVPRVSLFLGKVVACTSLVLLAALGNMASLSLTLAYLQTTLDVRSGVSLMVPFDPVGAAMAVPALVATALFVAAVNIAVVLVARTFKEGEMMGTTIMMFGILPGFAVVVSVIAGETGGLEFLPFGNLVLVIQRGLVGELSVYAAAIPTLLNGLGGLAAFGVAAWLVGREDFLIGGRLPRWLRWLHRSEPS